MTRISAQNLGFGFENREIFSDLNLEISEKRVGILGRNGSGKSTFARLVAGLYEPQLGVITVDGQNLAKDRKAALALVGIVFQNPDHQIIFPSVIEEIAFGFSQQGHKDAQARAQTVLEKYGIAAWKDRLITHLSQGQRHFIALISILEMQPAVLILDEPFTGLDIPTIMRLERVLAGFDGLILHITHETHLIADYDRAIWFEAGQVAADGAPKEVTQTYQSAMIEIGQSHADTGF